MIRTVKHVINYVVLALSFYVVIRINKNYDLNLFDKISLAILLTYLSVVQTLHCPWIAKKSKTKNGMSEW